MPEGLSLPDGGMPAAPAAVDDGNARADFARLMSAQADSASGTAESEIPAPPKREVDEKPRPRRGRPPKDAQARTRDAKPGDGKPAKGDGKPMPPKDFTADLTATGDAVWLASSSVPFLAPFAAVVHANQPALVATINAGAQTNAGVRNAVERLASGAGSAWALHAGLVAVSIATQCLAVMRDPDLRREVVEANANAVQAYMAELTGQMGAVAAAEAA